LEGTATAKEEEGARLGAQAPEESGEPSVEEVLPGALQDEIVRLEERVRDLEGQNMRLLADFDNLRRRQRRDEEEQRLRLQEEAAGLMLPLQDDLELALQAAPADDPLAEGVALVQRKLGQALGRLGLERIDALGRPFDPALHEAIGEEPSDLEPGTVATEVRVGYRIQDRVVRPALVRVAAPRE